MSNGALCFKEPELCGNVLDRIEHQKMADKSIIPTHPRVGSFQYKDDLVGNRENPHTANRNSEHATATLLGGRQ
jgi:hypothetical protein